MTFLFMYFTHSVECLRKINKKSQEINKLSKTISENMHEIVDNYNIIYETAKENEHFNKACTLGSVFCDVDKGAYRGRPLTSEYLKHWQDDSNYMFILFRFIDKDKHGVQLYHTLTSTVDHILEYISQIISLDDRYMQQYNDIMHLPASKQRVVTMVRPMNSSYAFSCKEMNFNFGQQIMFKNCNIDIFNNHWTMFYGKSGCGKSTFVNILMKQIPMGGKLSGNIMYMGQQNDYEYEDIRSDISYVKASGDLFNSSISYNLLYGVDQPNFQEVQKYLVLFKLNNFINRLEENINILSTGEKQRIKLIRAVLQDKKMWIMDESTSNIDNETEFIILEILKRIQVEKKKTVIHITHNLDNKMIADKIMTIQQKQIIYI